MHIEILVKDIRLAQNMSLSKLSQKSGVSITHINDVENNQKGPSLMVMVKLAKALGVQITDLYIVKW